jgi:hypothetical protein
MSDIPVFPTVEPPCNNIPLYNLLPLVAGYEPGSASLYQERLLLALTMSRYNNASSDYENTQSDGVFILQDLSDYTKWSDRMTNALIGQRIYSFIDSSELPPIRLNFTSRPPTIKQMRTTIVSHGRKNWM